MVTETKPSTAIVPFEPSNLDEALNLSKTLSASSLLPVPLRGKPADVLVVLLTGRELGLTPMQAIRSISVINGKPVQDAALIVGLCLRSPVCEYFNMVESTDKAATYETKRKGGLPSKLSYTWDQATKAGLTGKDNWKHHPAAMLRARCSSALARACYPDLVAGLYDTDEGEEMRREDKPSRRQPEPAKVIEITRPAPQSVPAPAPEPPPVIEGTVVAEAKSETGRTVRIVDVPGEEPPPPTDEHAPSAAPAEEPAGPPLRDVLLSELDTLTEAKALGDWIERCRASEKKGGLSGQDMTTLKDCYRKHCASLSKKGGAR